jgi:uncharacterized protein (TIGR03085 family)
MEQQNNWARSERHALADLMITVGPQAPTLCAGWTVKDLAAHIVMRERRPDAAAGIFMTPLRDYSEKVRKDLTSIAWAELAHQVRTGPPTWNPMSWGPIDQAANLFEFFVHHEDVLRAEEGWQPRVLDSSLENLMMKRLRNSAWLTWRRAKVGVILTDGESSIVAKRPPQHAGIVTVTGKPSELLMKSYGRSEVMIKVTGAESDIALFDQTNLSI